LMAVAQGDLILFCRQSDWCFGGYGDAVQRIAREQCASWRRHILCLNREVIDDQILITIGVVENGCSIMILVYKTGIFCWTKENIWESCLTKRF
jgi:hypothetical protein